MNKTPKQRVLDLYPEAYSLNMISCWRACTKFRGDDRIIAVGDTPAKAWKALADLVMPEQRVLDTYPGANLTALPMGGGWRAATAPPNYRRFTADGDTPVLAWAALDEIITRRLNDVD